MGTLYVVATPIGNLKDITYRAVETLNNVDIILCEDTRTSKKLLNHFNIKNKLISYHKFNESDRVHSIITYLEEGNNIALISDAGTPCISDPGYILIKALREKNINVVPIGGISASTSALSSSGINSDKFVFHGFFPRDTKGKKEIESLIYSKFNTHIFYESPRRIIKTFKFLNDIFPNCLVSVFKEITKVHEKNYYGKVSTVYKELLNDKDSSLGEYTFILYNEKQKTENTLSLEALIIDKMIKEEISLKEAINIIRQENNSLSKKDLYNAGLKLKDIFKWFWIDLLFLYQYRYERSFLNGKT